MAETGAPSRQGEVEAPLTPAEAGRLQALLRLAVAIGQREGLLGQGQGGPVLPVADRDQPVDFRKESRHDADAQ